MVVAKEKKKKGVMTTIWIEKALAEELKLIGNMNDNYTTVIRRLLNGRKGEPHEDRSDKGHESTGISNQESG